MVYDLRLGGVCVGCLRVNSFFFFFFKQKTAYEMRISDWSSDVCSSDLASPEPAHAPARGLPRALRGERRGALAGAGAKHPRSLPQIGRASCRERVCQYV